MFRLPDHILNALKSGCFLIHYTERRSEFGIVERELADLGYFTMRQRPGRGWVGRVWETFISAKGRRVLLDNLHPSELVTLIQDGVAVESCKSAAELVIGVPKKFLPELLSSSAEAVREAARERLYELNGLERRTN